MIKWEYTAHRGTTTMEVMNNYGQEGWQIVHIAPKIIIFGRPITQTDL